VLLRLQRAPQRERERERERERRERERSFIDNPEVTERVDHLFQHNSQTPHQLHISSSSSRTVASLVLPDLQSSLIVNKLLSLSLSLSLSLPSLSLSLSLSPDTKARLVLPLKTKTPHSRFLGLALHATPSGLTRASVSRGTVAAQSCIYQHLQELIIIMYYYLYYYYYYYGTVAAQSCIYQHLQEHYLHYLSLFILSLLLWDCSCSIMHTSTSSGTLSICNKQKGVCFLCCVGACLRA